MKRAFVFFFVLVTVFCFSGCKSGVGQDTPETVAKINFESGWINDFETYLSTCPPFRVRLCAAYVGVDKNSDIKTIASAMVDNGYEVEEREEEILNVSVLEQYKFTDYSIYNEWQEDYSDLTIDEFKMITDMAKVKIDFSLNERNGESVVLDAEATCIKMDGKWYVLKDEVFTF